MAATVTTTRDASTNSSPAGPSHSEPLTNRAVQGSRLANGKREMPVRVSRLATDDEILGIDLTGRSNGREPQLAADDGESLRGEEGSRLDDPAGAELNSADAADEPDNLRAAFDANPELRTAWQDAQSYRETFATPEEARAASAVLADVDRMDALFFSRQPEDHAALARVVASLNPEAFASLAQAMSGLATETRSRGDNPAGQGNAEEQKTRAADRVTNSAPARAAGPTQAQSDFFHATNAAAVESVIGAIETQVDRLLPDGISKSARNRVVGEIYREMDTTLRSNRQLTQQMREAFRSGGLDADHQRALVSLVAGRARQVLPGVAKRVLSEWTSTIVAANQDRRTRQRTAERRVDIAGSSGSGGEGQRSTTPRDIDYARMSDADILNL